VRHALTGGVGDCKKLAAPDRAIGSVACAIPRHAEHGRFEFVLRHARQDVSDMMLDANETGFSAVPTFVAPATKGCMPVWPVSWMAVGVDNSRANLVEGNPGAGRPADECWFRLVELLKILDHPAERFESLVGFQIANVLADENLGRRPTPPCFSGERRRLTKVERGAWSVGAWSVMGSGA